VNETFFHHLNSIGIEPDARMQERFRTYFDYLSDQNAVMNLTTIQGEEDVYLRHFYDSLAIVMATPVSGRTLLDVGSGAGFPSIPLKIAFPDLSVTIVDALEKRIAFLDRLVDRLGLTGVETIHGRAEEFDRREAYDIVTARAVAQLNVLAELCLPFARIDGLFIAMKTGECGAEISEAAHALEILGGRLERIVTYAVGPERNHALVVVRKISATPAGYPRTFARIKSKPL
jgi:16S rRNA (guanine527-N7)-methyltransferase